MRVESGADTVERAGLDPVPPAPPLLPAGTRLQADPSLRRRSGGRLLIGGSPLRFIRLTDAGSRLVTKWLAGDPVASRPGPTKLARRLIAAGMLHPSPPDPADEGLLTELTVVIPVKDDPDGLAATLASLPDVRVIVVDDGSSPPVPWTAVEGSGAPEAELPRRVVRRDGAGGPGVARQDALAQVATPLVAFVDAGVQVPRGALLQLGRWFADPTVTAVGPRVACAPGDDALSRYERRRSPLDLGPTPASVGADSTVTYLPTACLIARASAVRSAGGFDPALRWGEDVDLVWRLLEQGEVRYDPDVVVHHPARRSLRAFVRQRIGYGSAAGPLARRHGSRLAPVRMSGWSLACWALAFAGRPLLGIALAAGTAAALRRKLYPVVPDPGVEAALLTARGHWHAGRSLAGASTRAWWPVTVLALLAGPRRPAVAAVSLSFLGRIVLDNDGPMPERLLDWSLGVIDDGAYGAGVWLGALRNRAAGALLPVLVGWPPRDDPS